MHPKCETYSSAFPRVADPIKITSTLGVQQSCLLAPELIVLRSAKLVDHLHDKKCHVSESVWVVPSSQAGTSCCASKTHLVLAASLAEDCETSGAGLNTHLTCSGHVILRKPNDTLCVLLVERKLRVRVVHRGVVGSLPCVWLLALSFKQGPR
jgi:hypothetical protein